METRQNCNGGNENIVKQAIPTTQKMEIQEDEINEGNKNMVANSPSEVESSSSAPGQSFAQAGNQTPGSSAWKSDEKKLNPLAKDFDFVKDRATLDERSVYLTFSNGSPFSEYEISCFFNQKFGRCVERVFLHCGPDKNKPPLTGRVIFRFSCIPTVLLGDSGEAKFIVNSKPLRCKRFVPRKPPKQN